METSSTTCKSQQPLCRGVWNVLSAHRRGSCWEQTCTTPGRFCKDARKANNNWILLGRDWWGCYSGDARRGFFSSKEALRCDTLNANRNLESKGKDPGLVISGFCDGLYIPGPGGTTSDTLRAVTAFAGLEHPPKSQAGASREHCSTASDGNSRSGAKLQ